MDFLPYLARVQAALLFCRFAVNFMAQIPGETSDEKLDIALHFNVRWDQKCTVQNSTIDGIWQFEERAPGLGTLSQDADFVVSFLVMEDKFAVRVLLQGFAVAALNNKLAPIVRIMTRKCTLVLADSNAECAPVRLQVPDASGFTLLCRR